MVDRKLEARILVCDPYESLFQSDVEREIIRHFDGKDPTLEAGKELVAVVEKNRKKGEGKKEGLLAIFGDVLQTQAGFWEQYNPTKVAITRVATIKNVLEEVRKYPAPYYSLVVYEANQLKVEGAAGIVARVNKRDPFLPQMVVSKGIDNIVERMVSKINKALVENAEAEKQEITRQVMIDVLSHSLDWVVSGINRYIATEQLKTGKAVTEISKQIYVSILKDSGLFGSGLEDEIAGQFARSGGLYYATSEKIMRDIIVGKIFRKQMVLTNATVIKIGGSATDYERENRKSKNLRDVCRVLSEIHQEREANPRKRKEINRIITTIGAGQIGNILKDWFDKYKDDEFSREQVNEEFPKLMANALHTNLQMIQPFFDSTHPQKYGKADLYNTGAFYHIGKNTSAKRIPLIPTAPHWIMARDGIPLKDSDTHTIALAEFYGIKKVVLVKRTDGIYNSDPYEGYRMNPSTYQCDDFDHWRSQQRGKNKKHDRIAVQDLLKGKISRIGADDQRGGHLMEDSALEYFVKCDHVQEIVVVHIAPEEMYYRHGKSGNVYTHVVTGEKKQVTPESGGWHKVLRDSLYNAIVGDAQGLSKIVR